MSYKKYQGGGVTPSYTSYSQGISPTLQSASNIRGKGFLSKLAQQLGLTKNVESVRADIKARDEALRKKKGANPFATLMLSIMNPFLGAAYAGGSEFQKMRGQEKLTDRYADELTKKYGKKVGGQDIINIGALTNLVKNPLEQWQKQYDYSTGDYLQSIISKGSQAWMLGDVQNKISTALANKGDLKSFDVIAEEITDYFTPGGKATAIEEIAGLTELVD
jgi:hypothetical protein